MVIDIPSDSEASEATAISGFPISKDVEIQSIEDQQLQQPPEINTMARTRKKQSV